MENGIVKYIFGAKYVNHKRSVKLCKQLIRNVRSALRLTCIEVAYGVIIFTNYCKLKGNRTRAICTHNMLCVALMLSNKLLIDVPYKNTVWANFMHLPLSYFNLLEHRFLRETRFNIIPSDTEFRKIWKLLFTEV